MSTTPTQDFLTVCHTLYEKGFVTATDGNVSLRISQNEVLTTPTARCKGWLTEEDLVVVDLHGKHLHGKREASSELKMHLFLYKQREDVRAIVHAHPPYATAFAVAGKALDVPVLPEVILGIGAIPLAPYATPSTDEVAASLAPFAKDHQVILLENHGIVAMGNDLRDAFFKMEKAEHAAKIILLARVLGGERQLSEKDVEKLLSLGR